jgi:hypothetical protein
MNENVIVVEIDYFLSIFSEMQNKRWDAFSSAFFFEVALAFCNHFLVNTQFDTKQSLSVNALSSNIS